MTQPAVLLDLDAATGVATITLNRPASLNALDRALSDGLRDAVAQVEFDDAVRADVIASQRAVRIHSFSRADTAASRASPAAGSLRFTPSMPLLSWFRKCTSDTLSSKPKRASACR